MNTTASTPRVTLAAVTAAVQPFWPGAELVKGDGYFYFIGNGAERLKSASVYVPRLGDLALDRWVADARAMVAELADDGYDVTTGQQADTQAAFARPVRAVAPVMDLTTADVDVNLTLNAGQPVFSADPLTANAATRKAGCVIVLVSGRPCLTLRLCDDGYVYAFGPHTNACRLPGGWHGLSRALALAVIDSNKAVGVRRHFDAALDAAGAFHAMGFSREMTFAHVADHRLNGFCRPRMVRGTVGMIVDKALTRSSRPAFADVRLFAA